MIAEHIEIGTFKRARDGGWDGEINTLTIEHRKVRLAPNDNLVGDNPPAFRLMLGQQRIGRAWEARSRGDPPRDYLRLRFDDPAFVGTEQAALFFDDEGSTGRLVWNRRVNDRPHGG